VAGGGGGGRSRFETSSKKGYSVEDLFDTIVYDFVKRGAGYASPPSPGHATCSLSLSLGEGGTTPLLDL
jgi:hypothetical protein